ALDRRWPRLVVHELPVPPRLHEPRTGELFEVMRDRCLAHRKTVAKPLTANFPALRNVLEDLHATGIRQRLSDPLKLLSVHKPLHRNRTIDRYSSKWFGASRLVAASCWLL